MNESLRALNKSEYRLLESALAFRQRRWQRGKIFGLIAFVIALGALCIATVFAPWQVSAVAWTAGIVISVWSYSDVRRDILPIIRRLESALRSNQARVVRIQSTAVVEFEEEEDEGAAYAFQLEGEKIVVISGQDFYPSAKFPNSDFSLVDILGEDGSVVEGTIAKQGTKLKPTRVIPAKVWRTLRVPDHLETIAGTLDHLEQLLAR